ncbi:MAG TPA: hypothetical protein VFK85_11370 [Anaeromyxobacteraceae bacterium]|nr:hypothetical protein [Anaeromyxobacteraceae bacterium]
MAAVMDRPGGFFDKPGYWDQASWGALFAGFFVGTGTLFLLLTFGAAVGFTAVDPRNFDSWRNAGIGVGIWGGISAIIASFFSAWVAGRLSKAWTRLGGALHGLALWGLTWGVTMWLGAMFVGGAVAGAAGAAGQAATAAAQSGQVSQSDVRQGRETVRQQVAGAQQQLQQNAGEISQTAESTGKKGAWGAFLAALFTMLASAAGGASAVAKRHVVGEDLEERHGAMAPSPAR